MSETRTGPDAGNAPPDENLISDEMNARWLGNQAARRGCVAAGRSLVDPSVMGAYQEGAAHAETSSHRARLTDAERKSWIRRLEAVAAATSRQPQARREPPPLPARIVRVVQRADVGTATRYDLTLSGEDGEITLQDLRAADLLTWSRLRPIALDSLMVLPSLSKGQGQLWHDEVRRAMREAERGVLGDEDSEAMRVRAILRDLSSSARKWEWSEEDDKPRGVARIEHNGWTGWPRGALTKEVRAHMGSVSYVAFRRARASLGWSEAEWRIETARILVWATKEKT